MNKGFVFLSITSLLWISGCTINQPPYAINAKGERVYGVAALEDVSAPQEAPQTEKAKQSKSVETFDITVNDAKTGEDRELQLTYFVSPYYPDDENRDGEVEVEFKILLDGSTSDVRIIHEDYPGAFDYIVLDIVRRWRFVPQNYKDTYRLVLGFEP